jgi:uncharacterized protein (TIGR03435 family)
MEERLKTGSKRFSPSEMLGPGSYVLGGGPGGFQLTAKAITMEALANALFSIAGRRKVIDKTGLTGLYDIQMRFANPFNPPSPPDVTNPASAEEPSPPTIFKALQEQLGLKLEEGNAPLDAFIIDSVEKPSEN